MDTQPQGVTTPVASSQSSLSQQQGKEFPTMIKKSMKQQIAFIIAFLILLGVIGGGVFAYTQLTKKKTEDNTTNTQAEKWKECNGGSDLPVTMQIPDSWTCQKTQDELDDGTKTWDIDITSPEKLTVSFINGSRQVAAPTHCGCEANATECLANGGHVCTEETFLDSDKYTCIAQMYTENGVKKSDWINCVVKGVAVDQEIFSAIWFYKDDNSLPTDSEKETLKKIFNSVKNTTYIGWKTYTNVETKYNYVFMYPSDWSLTENPDRTVVVTNGKVNWLFGMYQDYTGYDGNADNKICYPEGKDIKNESDFLCDKEKLDESFQLFGIDVQKQTHFVKATDQVYYINFGEKSDDPQYWWSPGFGSYTEPGVGEMSPKYTIRYTMVTDTVDIKTYESILDNITKSLKFANTQ
jgi:hypothetical protein